MDNEQKKEHQTPEPQRNKDIPLDTRLLSEAVIELNISRKNVGIYPPGHAQITKSIDRAFFLLQKLFEIRSEMTLGVAKDTLLVGEDYLDQKNPVYRDCALSMNQQEIGAVTFIRGLDKDELIRFHRILTTKPEEIRDAGGIMQVMRNAAIEHIRIHVIDYGSFHLTEEDEIVQSGKSTSQKSSAGVWQDFISHLSAGTLAAAGTDGVSLKDTEQIHPAELARLLNERKLDSDAALQSYDRIISDHVRQRAEKKEMTQEQSATLENLSTLLHDLHPELRKQFLSVAFRRISTHANRVDAEELVGGFEDDMVIDMLKQASAEGREISPTLTGLLGKLTKAHAGGVGASGKSAGTTAEDAGTMGTLILPEHMEKLFDREMYEDYVSDDYEAMLRRLTENSGPGKEQFSLETVAKTLQDDHVDFQIGRAMLAFMEENLDEDDYKELAVKLTDMMPGFLKSGNFFLLWDIFETLRRHTTEKPVKAIRECAKQTREFMTTPEFKAKSLEAFEWWIKDKGQEGAGFIQALGADMVAGLFDILSREQTQGGKRIIVNLLCIFGAPAVREAHKRLRDAKSSHLRTLLFFLRKAANPSSATQVRPLLQHADAGIRLEALSTLLRLNDESAIKVLKQLIRASDSKIVYDGIELAGRYRVNAVVDDILAKLKRTVLFEADYALNEEIIKRLGEIGDPRALRDLEKLARATWSIYPQSLLKMKETLFESLERYPRESIRDLLNYGERLDSERIKLACKKLIGGK